MKSSRILAVTGASVAALALAISPLLPAQAATFNEWGVWSEPSSSSGDGNGTLAYTDTNFIGAEYVYQNTTNVESLNSDDGAWFEADTPIGAVFGASGPWAVADRLRIDADAALSSVLTITFDSPVPAGQLGFAISDVDDDQVTVVVEDADGNDITGAEINGTATDQAFNFCVVATPPADCGGDTDVPSLTTNANDVVAFSSGSSDGATAWFRPSVAVKVITLTSTIYGDPGAEGHHDFWIAQTRTVNDELPATGLNASAAGWMFGAGIALLTAGGLIVARRRA